MLSEFAKVLLFLIIGVVFVAGALIVNRLIRPHRPNPEKSTIYECGEEPIGNPWIRFNIRFYTVALVFLIFEVEVVFLFPWAVIYKELGLFAFIEMVVFLLILILGYVYAWAKGDLEWDKPKPKYFGVEREKREVEEVQA
ncbi:MAG: NADH-quinone oxidoreductase subunit A [Candidatus Kryptonium sp.]